MKVLISLTTCVAAAFSAPLAAQSFDAGTVSGAEIELVQARTLDDLLSQLQATGYTIDDISRTFLGRFRVIASNGTTTREIIMSRTTGEIFSDIVRSREAGPEDEAGGPSTRGSAASNGVAGGNANGSGETGSAASAGRSENSGGRSDRAGRSRDNGGAGRSNRSD